MTATLGVRRWLAGKRSADRNLSRHGREVGIGAVSSRAEPSPRSGQALKVSATGPLRRWLAFNLVGGLGILIQLSTLAALTAGVGLHYLLATGLAVEVAVLHNFMWHERWTWRDRAAQDKRGRWKRLGRFQIANGALSLGGNLVLMQILVGAWAMNYTLANGVSITLCSILNFLASDRLVFPPARSVSEITVSQRRINNLQTLESRQVVDSTSNEIYLRQTPSTDPCPSRSAISRSGKATGKTLRKDKGRPPIGVGSSEWEVSWAVRALVERRAAGEYTHAKVLAEESPDRRR